MPQPHFVLSITRPAKYLGRSTSFVKICKTCVTLEKILEWSERLEILELALYDEAGGQRTEFAINQLRMMQQFSQLPGLTPLSSELEDGLADVLTFAQALFGGMSDARDGFAADIGNERN